MASFLTGSKKGSKLKPPPSGEQRQSKRLNPDLDPSAGSNNGRQLNSLDELNTPATSSTVTPGTTDTPLPSSAFIEHPPRLSPPRSPRNENNEEPPRFEENEEEDSDTDSTDSSSSADYMPTDSNSIRVSEGVEIAKVNGLPRVTTQNLNAQVLRDFEDYSNLHFAVHPKHLTEKRKMKLIAGCFANKEVMNWIVTESDKQGDTVTFAEFVDKLRKQFLPSNWEVQVQRDLLSEMMKDDDKYIEWAAVVKKKNDVLKNTAFFHDSKALREFLQHHLCGELTTAVYGTTLPNGTKLNEVRDLTDWEEEVRVLDEKRWNNRKMVRDVFESERKREAKLYKAASTSQKNNKTTEKKSQPSQQKKDPGDVPKELRCPRLTQEERDILKDFFGCYKCRRTLVHHESKDCPFGWPSIDDYEVVKRPSKAALDAFRAAANAGPSDRNGKGKAPIRGETRPNKKQKTTAAVDEPDTSGEIIAAMNEAGDTTGELSDDN